METPSAPRRARMSWAEMEFPDDPRRRVRVSWAEMETPAESEDENVHSHMLIHHMSMRL
jgi:hypothetical protein